MLSRAASVRLLERPDSDLLALHLNTPRTDRKEDVGLAEAGDRLGLDSPGDLHGHTNHTAWVNPCSAGGIVTVPPTSLSCFALFLHSLLLVSCSRSELWFCVSASFQVIPDFGHVQSPLISFFAVWETKPVLHGD